MALTDAQKDAAIVEAVLPVRITLAGTVTKGDAIGYASGWKRALATVGTAIQARLVALDDGVSGDVITAAPGAVVGGNRLSGMTAGNPIYLAEGSDNGKYTETAPSTTGDVNVVIGRSIDATSAWLAPGLRGPDTVA